MDTSTMARLLREVAEGLERLAGGEDGLMHDGDNAPSVAELLVEVQAIAKLVEDETGRRFTRLDGSEIEDVVNGWYDDVEKVAARRGEDC